MGKKEFNLELYQQTAWQALCEIDDICREHEIAYYIIEGTMLGAVRHHGFIPWDDDIDIGVFREDTKKLSELLQKHLSDKFYYDDCHINPEFPRLYGKVLDKGSGYGCVDVFPLIKTSNRALGRRLQWCLRKIIFKLYKAKIGYRNHNETKGFLAWSKLFIAKGISLLFTKDTIMRLVEKNETMYERHKNSTYYVVLYGAHPMNNETIKAEWMEPKAMVKFNERKFPTFGKTDLYLRNTYGDYMTPVRMDQDGLRHDEVFRRS